MMIKVFKFSRSFLIRWLLANIISWPVGIIIAIILSYTIVNVFHPEETNLIMGLCIGISVGFFQWLVLKEFIVLNKWWIIISGLGIGIPYAFLILLEEGGFVFPNLFNIEGIIWGISFFISGAIVGALQMRMLRVTFSNSYIWIIISSIAWGISLLFKPMFYSGLLLGLITIVAFVWILKSKSN